MSNWGTFASSTIHSFDAADTFLQGGRSKTDRPLPGKATRLVRRGADKIAVQYWVTDIVTFHRNGDIELHSGGWNTLTTRRKMTEYLPSNGGYMGGSVYSNKGTMMVGWHGTGYVFEDGIILHPDGTVTGAASEEKVKADAKLAKRINQYVEAYAKKLVEGKIGVPSTGDCWYCCMEKNVFSVLHEDGTVDNGVILPTHLLSHMDEKYYVPSLIWRAMQEMGASRAHQDLVARFQSGFGQEGYWAEYVTRETKSVLRRYMRRELGLA